MVSGMSLDPAVHSPGTCSTSWDCSFVGAGAHHFIPCPETASNVSFRRKNEELCEGCGEEEE